MITDERFDELVRRAEEHANRIAQPEDGRTIVFQSILAHLLDNEYRKPEPKAKGRRK